MATTKKPMTPESAPATAVGLPVAPYTEHHDHSFTLQAIMELQKAVGGLEVAFRANTAALEKLDARLDRASDRIETRIGEVESKLSGVTHKIYAAGVVLALLVAVGAFVVDKAWDITVAHLSTVSQKEK